MGEYPGKTQYKEEKTISSIRGRREAKKAIGA